MSPIPTYFGEQQAQVPAFFASEPWMAGDKGALWYSPTQPMFAEPSPTQPMFAEPPKAEMGPFVGMQPVYFYAIPVQQPQPSEMQCMPQQGAVQIFAQPENLSEMQMQQMPQPTMMWQPCPSQSSTCCEERSEDVQLGVGMWQPCPSQTSQGSTCEELSEGVMPSAGDVYRLSRDVHGTRQIQDALENASCAVAVAMAAELRGHVWELLKCPHGNFVLQKCIVTLPPKESQFIIDELSMVGVDKVVRHRFGCRVVQRLLEHCPQEQLQPLTLKIQQDSFALSTHVYGHYVLQHLVEHGSPEDKQGICAMLIECLPWVGSSMYGVELVGTALCHAAPEEEESLVRSLVSSPKLMAQMASSRHGHVAAKQALKLATESDRQVALAELAKEDARLRASRYGRVFSKFLEKCRRGELSE